MKVLLMHRADGDAGGGQVQMRRLQAGLRGQGIDAGILCRERSHAGSVLMPRLPRAERWLGRLTGAAGLNDIHLVSSSGVRLLPEVRAADVIDLHCLHSGTFSYLALPALTAEKPVVFTLHDMWALTGHCHASLDCGRWRSGCGSCPYPETEPAVRRDLTAVEWRLKRWAYRRSNFTVVVPSRWMLDQVRDSLLGNFPVRHIPHGVDTEIFRPLDKRECRAELGIPAGKKVLLCAMESMHRPLKGAALLARAIQALPTSLKQQCVLVFFGRSDPSILRSLGMPVFDLGYLHDDARKVLAYNAADLLLHPSRAESFGLVPLESMACGTPVAAFAVGGLPELVRPGVSGILAVPDDSDDLARAAGHLLGDAQALETLSVGARSVVEKEYPLERQVGRCADLYRKLAGFPPDEATRSRDSEDADS